MSLQESSHLTSVGDRRGPPCMAFTEHGYLGMEAKTIKAILSWVRAGAVLADVTEKKVFTITEECPAGVIGSDV